MHSRIPALLTVSFQGNVRATAGTVKDTLRDILRLHEEERESSTEEQVMSPSSSAVFPPEKTTNPAPKRDAYRNKGEKRKLPKTAEKSKRRKITEGDDENDNVTEDVDVVGKEQEEDIEVDEVVQQKRGISCKFCKREFKYTKSLKEHVKNEHGRAKRFKCYICDREFDKNSNLKRHIDNHQRKATKTCAICQQSFVLTKELRTHVFREHTERKCNKCNFKGIPKLYRQHMKTHEPTKFHGHKALNNICALCGAEIKTHGGWFKHMKMHHKDIDTDGVTEEGGEGHDDSQEREEEEHADNQKSEEEGYDDSKESEGEEHADSQESEKEGHDDIQESEEEESRLNTSDEESTMVNLNESDILRYSIEPEIEENVLDFTQF